MSLPPASEGNDLNTVLQATLYTFVYFAIINVSVLSCYTGLFTILIIGRKSAILC